MSEGEMSVKELIGYFKNYKKTYNEFPLPTPYQISDDIIDITVGKLERYEAYLNQTKEKE